MNECTCGHTEKKHSPITAGMCEQCSCVMFNQPIISPKIAVGSPSTAVTKVPVVRWHARTIGLFLLLVVSYLVGRFFPDTTLANAILAIIGILLFFCAFVIAEGDR